jgi:hypothetical protein
MSLPSPRKGMPCSRPCPSRPAACGIVLTSHSPMLLFAVHAAWYLAAAASMYRAGGAAQASVYGNVS